MSVRLLRESSDTPNITNRDDTRMIRYAYGGSNGVVKNFGDELSHSISGSKFILNSGMIVLQGWEVEVASWELDLSTVTGTQYHLVYLEINVAAETAVIKSTYLTGSVPSVDLGNDLTQYPQGTARIPLYSFRISSKTISSVEKKFSVLEYEQTQIDTIKEDIFQLEERLSKLGFKEGSVASNIADTSLIAKNFLKRQGNYVLGEYAFSVSPMASLDELSQVTNFGVVPEQFRPLSNASNVPVVLRGLCQMVSASGNEVFAESYFSGFAQISKDTGIISWSTPPNLVTTGALFANVKFSTFYMQFGYEAAPLT